MKAVRKITIVCIKFIIAVYAYVRERDALRVNGKHTEFKIFSNCCLLNR